MSRTIKVFEHERLTLHANVRGEKLLPDELQKLYEFNDRHNNKYFTGVRDGVKFSSYVGVIQIGGLTLEILPKADIQAHHDGNHETITSRWRNVLVQMLAITRHIPVESVSQASLERRHYSILDLYFELFLNEVQKLLHRGLIKKYRNTSGNLPVLKGRLDFNRNIQENLIHRQRFYTHHQVYDQDHLLNQILFRALCILDRITTSLFIKDRLARTLLDFPEINDVRIQKHHFDGVRENKKTVSYHEAIRIARMIILNYSPDIRGGREDVLAIIFDMNVLWQEYILLQLKKSVPEGITVYKGSKPFWETQPIEPDIVIQTSEGFHILDTKWKVLEQSTPSAADLKQMFAYNLYWNCKNSMLVYPKTESSPANLSGAYHQGMVDSHRCTLAFTSLLDESGYLRQDCVSEIVNFLKLKSDSTSDGVLKFS